MSFKNDLQEHVQKYNCKLPSYKLEDSSGPSHDPRYKYSVSVRWTNGVCYTEEGDGKNKKDAQQEAARKMLERLGLLDSGTPKASSPYATPPRVTSTTDRSDDDIFLKVLSPTRVKMELQIILQRNGMPLPRYTVQRQSGPSHNPVFTVKLEIFSGENQVIWEAIGTGHTKQGAECNAAEKGLEFVNSTVEKDGDLYLLKLKEPKRPLKKDVDPAIDQDLSSQLPRDTETVFIKGDGDEEMWLCMKMVKHKTLRTTVASHGEGESKEEAERQANFNLIHSIQALHSI